MTSSARQKGYRNQSKCIKHFQQQGYEVAITERNSKFSKERDAYGLFDINCMNDKESVWVQVTSNKPHVHKGYIDFSIKHPINNVKFQQWVHHDHKGWVVYTYTNGVKVKEDLRK
jgi:hypothetical protein